MKKTISLFLFISLLPIIHVYGSEKTFLISPVFKYYFVDNDTVKFRELNDTKRNFIGGLDQLLLKSPLGSTLDFDLDVEKALIENNEYRGILNIFNKNDRDLFDFKMGINAFNRYYDNTGGHHGAITPSSFNIDRDLILFDGKLFATIAAPIFNFAHMDLEYLWHHKQGKSANLNWGAARTAPYTGNTRKFVPGFTNLRRENLHEFSLNLSKEIKGYEIEFKNDLAILREVPVREEHNRNSATPSMVRQITKLDGFNYAATLKTLKHFKEDRFIGSLVYRFEKGSSEENEDLRVFTEATGAQVSGNNRYGAEADNKISQHIWGINLLSDLGKNFFLTTRGRVNLKSRSSDATYPRDTDTDGIINNTNNIDTSDKGFGFGEQLILTYKGRTAFTPYLKAELEQNILKLTEDQVNTAAADDFYRTTKLKVYKFLVTGGFYSYPYRWMKLSAQGFTDNNIDSYKDTREIAGTPTSDKSAFVDDMRNRSYGTKTTISIRPLSWLYTDYRFQWSDTQFRMLKEAAPASVKSHSRTQKHMGVLTLIPWDYLTLIESFAYQKLETNTIAQDVSSVNLPKNKGGFNTFLSSLTYDVGDKLSLKADYQKTWSNDNFDDFSGTGLPVGIDHKFDNLHVEAGWKIRKNLEITPSYETGLYRISSRAHIDDYDYHLASVKATLKNF